MRCSPTCIFDDCVLVFTGSPPPEEDTPQQSSPSPSQAPPDTKQSTQQEQSDEPSNSSPSQSPGDSHPQQDNRDQAEQPAPTPQSSDGGGTDGAGRGNNGSSHQTSGRPENKQKDSGGDRQDDAQPPTQSQPRPDRRTQHDKSRENKETEAAENGGNGAGSALDKLDEETLTKVLTDQTFIAKLRNTLKDNAYDRRVKGRKRGKLDMRALYKVPAKAETVFTLKEARKNKHYNVVLVVDQSGSMQGYTAHDLYKHRRTKVKITNKILKVAEMGVFLARALDKVGVNYAVVGFDDSATVHKPLSQALRRDQLSRLEDVMGVCGGGTQVIPGLKTALKELTHQPHDYKNIVILLTDGEPDESKQKVVDYIQQSKRHADFIEVGIDHASITPEGFLVRSLNDLKPLILKEIKRRVVRG